MGSIGPYLVSILIADSCARTQTAIDKLPGKEMTDAERLLAIENIKRLMARRIRAMDTKDWALYDTCHAEDATLDSFGTLPERHKPAGSIARGKGQILAMIRKVVDGTVKVTTVHHAHMPEI